MAKRATTVAKEASAPKKTEAVARPRKKKETGELRPLEGETAIPSLVGAEDAAESQSGLNEEQKQALLTQHLDSLEALTEQKDKIIAQIRSERKAAKASGFSRGQIDFGLELKRKGEEALRLRMQRQLQVAGWLGKPIQLTLDI